VTTVTAVTLDDAAAVRRRDPGGMLGHVAAFGDQLRAGWEISRGLELVDNHTKATAVAVLGMGGSAMCADLVRAVFSDRLAVPVVSVRDYTLPAWVGQRTLVVAVSHSGATEETISALSAALERRCPVVVVTTGGPIGDVAARVKLPRLIYPDQTPPRASLGYTFALLAGLLERAGMLQLNSDDVELAIDASATVVRACAPDVDTAQNIAKQVAWAMLDRLPVIQASGALAAVARRWKTQLNENANSAAVAEELPEATHNAVVGYDQPDILHDHQHVVFLQSASDHPRNAYRAKLSAELLDAVRIGHQSITVEGDSRLAEACAAVTLGDYVSVYLGLLYGMDPSATGALTTVKIRMAAFGKDDDSEGEDATDGD
jgi:glucose/mannose-6-phosphate isomerase